LRRLTRTVLEESAAAGVIYTEIFLSPDFCGGRDLYAWKDYLAAIEEAARAAEAADGIVMRGIVTCIRHFGPGTAKQTALCAAETAGEFVVGFGMAGDELAGKPGDFTWAFDMAREAKLGLTAHAGEWDGPQSVRDALADLRVDSAGPRGAGDRGSGAGGRSGRTRRGAGGLPGLEHRAGALPVLGKHPVERLRAAGVKVTISTDDPPFFATTMTRERVRPPRGCLRLGRGDSSPR
jgi:adenosine deaminase